MQGQVRLPREGECIHHLLSIYRNFYQSNPFLHRVDQSALNDGRLLAQALKSEEVRGRHRKVLF